MRLALSCSLGLLSILVSHSCYSSDSERVLTDQQWVEDLRQMSMSIKAIHFKPFHVLAEADFDAAVQKLESRISGLSDLEIIVDMTRIVARLRDGHTRLHMPRLYPQLAVQAELGHSGTNPPRFGGLKFRQSPVRFEIFDDGAFIIKATPEYRELIGQEVLEVDGTPIDEAIKRARSVSFFENDSRAMLMAPDRLALPDVTKILDISRSSDVVSWTTVDASGNKSATALRTLNKEGSVFVSGAPTPLPLWQARSDEFRWYKILAEQNSIYVQVNQFEENPQTPYGDFVAETIRAARVAGVDRLIIDLRHNSGGVGAWVTPFVTGVSRSEYNDYGRLYVLVGRNTFSAAQHFMHRFEELTYAIFVGEPSGAKPSHFGDPNRVVLDNSGLTLRISTIYWHSWLANDFRDAIKPHVSASLTSADFSNGVDPVLTAALEYEPPESLALQIDEQFRQGKNQNALLQFVRFMSDATLTNHRKVIPDLRAMADKLVDDGMIRQGYFVYFLANSSYPGDPATRSGLERIEALMAESE